MRTLSPTLLAAQQAGSRTPYVKVEVKNQMTGVRRLVWENLYLGTETEYYHSLTAAGDGGLIRVRISPASDGSKLYRQRLPILARSPISAPGLTPVSTIARR